MLANGWHAVQAQAPVAVLALRVTAVAASGPRASLPCALRLRPFIRSQLRMRSCMTNVLEASEQNSNASVLCPGMRALLWVSRAQRGAMHGRAVADSCCSQHQVSVAEKPRMHAALSGSARIGTAPRRGRHRKCTLAGPRRTRCAQGCIRSQSSSNALTMSELASLEAGHNAAAAASQALACTEDARAE